VGIKAVAFHYNIHRSQILLKSVSTGEKTVSRICSGYLISFKIQSCKLHYISMRFWIVCKLTKSCYSSTH